MDNRVKEYPEKFSKPEDLAALIQRDFSLPEEKARAIFTWIALNVEYDIKALKSGPKTNSFTYSSLEEKDLKLQKLRQDLAVQTLRKRKAVCQGYSTLYKYMCDLLSIDCEIITGTCRTRKEDIGKLPLISNHVWNVVKINNEWKLIDVTWGAGYVNENASHFFPEFNDIYFFSNPEIFFLKHFPEDRSWLLTDHSKEDFADLPLYYPGALKMNVELIEPLKGIISYKKNKAINLALKNSIKDAVSVKFDNDTYSQLLQPILKNDICYYNIAYEKKQGSYFTIFVNSRPFVTYKIERN